MKTTKTYVRKTYTSQLLAQGEDTLHSVTQTAMYLYPEDVGELARNHRSKQDEVYEWVLVTETVTPLSTAESNALVMQGRTMSKAAREALA
jgi:hypothetical protein